MWKTRALRRPEKHSRRLSTRKPPLVKKLYLVAPVKAPSKDPVKIGDITEMMKNMEINNRKQGNIKLIETKFSRFDDDIYEDDLHLNHSFERERSN